MRIALIGDSLTQGYGVQVQQRFSSLLGVDHVNSGISGDTTGGMLARFYEMVIKHNPSHVFIMGGTNDIFMKLDHHLTISNILAMCRYARFHEIVPIIGIPTPILGQGESEVSYGLNHAQAKVALETYVKDLMCFCQDDGLAVVDFNTGFEDQWMLDDGVHPNDLGHEYMAEVLKSFLEKQYND